jgi:hypothetical protein
MVVEPECRAPLLGGQVPARDAENVQMPIVADPIAGMPVWALPTFVEMAASIAITTA